MTRSVADFRDVQARVRELMSVDHVYPVGAVYISVVDTDPGTLFGGTWEAFGTGRTLVGVDEGQTEFDSVEETGGAKTHTLTTAEMPTHTHPVTLGLNPSTADAEANPGSRLRGAYASNGAAPPTSAHTVPNPTSAGSGNAHNNLPPYITVYMWKRTA